MSQCTRIVGTMPEVPQGGDLLAAPCLQVVSPLADKKHEEPAILAETLDMRRQSGPADPGKL